MTISIRIPTKTPTEVREEIAQLIVTNLVGSGDGEIRTVYDYRSLPNLTQVEANVTSFGSLAISSPILGDPYYDHIIDVRVQHDNSQAGLRSAEQAVTGIMRSIWVMLATEKATTYREAYPYQADQTPGAPAEVAKIRRGFMFVRVTPY